MAFTLQVIRGATTYTIADPFFLEGAEGLGGASVRNIEESGPYQDGATHLDERLDARTITLKLNVMGSSAAVLDGHRDTLMKMFKPVSGVPITLKITRDDNSVRQIDTRRTGPLDIPLVAINRPGNLHRAVVQLRAADPVWYDPTEQSEDFDPPTGNWWLGYATIGSANVMEHVESPTQGQLWAHTGSVAAGSPFTIAFRTPGSTPPANAPGDFAFDVSSVFGASERTAFYTFGELWGGEGAGFGWVWTSGSAGESMYLNPGTQNVFMVSSGTSLAIYQGTTLYSSRSGATGMIRGTASGTARWRSDYTGTATSYWNDEIPYAAVYNVALDSTQRSSLNSAMAAAGTVVGGSAYSVAIDYQGDIDSYPVITLTGPIADPVITNVTTGDTLDFTGGTVGSAEIWTIDTRYGRKSALSGTTSIASYLSADSNLSTFRLVPSPIASGGTNSVTVSSTDSGTAASVTVSYYNRYLSF